MSKLQTIHEDIPLSREGGEPFGVLSCRYRARRLVQLDFDANQFDHPGDSPRYIIELTQRIVIPSQVQRSLKGFEKYPVMIRHSSVPDPGTSAGMKFSLVAYDPKTVNSTVESSTSASDGKSTNHSRHQAWGSSSSSTNTYGISASLGVFGESITGDVSGNYSESTTWENNQSSGMDLGGSADHQASNAESMSIKNWCSVAAANLTSAVVQWVWAQEYPWNVLQYQESTDGDKIIVPQYVIDRLFAQDMALPPSDLSLFGVDFVCKSAWIATPTAGEDASLSFKHTLLYKTGEHAMDGTARLKLSTTTPGGLAFKSKTIDLAFLALNVIQSDSVANGAVIAFNGGQFLAPPTTSSGFAIVSARNNLLVRGAGFDGKMIAPLGGGATAKLTVFFKLIDRELQISLHFRHWKTADTPCVMKIIVNGMEHSKITKHIDASEAEGGEGNLLAVSLRSNDHLSNDYHDFLRPGANKIEIEICAADLTATDCGYVLRALAIA